MARVNTIFRNIAANHIGVFGRIAIAFIISPFLVNSLGDTKYGIWSIIAALTGYMALMDIGVNSALVKYVAEYNSTKDYKRLNLVVSSALLMFFIITTALVLLSPLIAHLVVTSMNFEASLEEMVRLVVVIASFDIALFIIAGTFRGTLAGMQRYEILNIAGLLGALYKAVLFYVFISKGFDLVAMIVISVTANFGIMLALFWLVKRSYPFIEFNPFKANWKYVKKVLKFSQYIFLAMLANQLIYYSDAFVIGYFMTAAAVTYYTIPWSLAEYTNRLVLGISGTFIPVFSELDAGESTSSLFRTYVVGTKVVLILSNLICVGILVVGSNFVGIWMGEKYALICAPILTILFISQIVKGPQQLSYSILQGIGKHKQFAYLNFFFSFLNLGLNIVLVQKYGLIGVASGTAITQILFYGVLVPVMTHRILKTSLFDYLKQTYLRSIVPTVILAIALYCLAWIREPDGYLILLGQALLAAVFYLIAVYLFMLDTDERNYVREKVRNKLNSKRNGAPT